MIESVEELQAFGQNRQFRKWLSECAEDEVALLQRAADEFWRDWGLDRVDILPEVERVSRVFVGAGRDLWVQWNDGSAVEGEVLGHGDFPGEPLFALAWAGEIGDNARNQSFREAEDKRVAVLQNIAAVRRDAVGFCGLRGGVNRKFEA